MERITVKDIKKLSHRKQVMFALFCAEQVKPYTNDKTRELASKVIAVVEAYLEGKATKEDCEQVGDTVWKDLEFFDNAIANAARAGVNAAWAAADNSDRYHTSDWISWAVHWTIKAIESAGVDKDKLIKAQWDYYYELLNFETNFEKIVLGG